MLGAARCSRCLRASRLNSAGRPLWQCCSRPLSIWRAVPVYRKGEPRAGAAQRRRRGACSRAAPHQGRALEGSTGHASVLQLGHIVATDANDPASRDRFATALILLECVGCARNSDLCVLREHEQSYHVVTAHRPPWRDACVRATQSRFARFPAHLLRRQSPEGVATQPKQAAAAAAMPTWLGGALDRGVERTPQPPRVLPQSSRASLGDCGPVDGHSIPGDRETSTPQR